MMDRETGGDLSGFAHVVQSLGVIFSTRLGEREGRRWFGALNASLLGETMTRANVLRFISATIIATELWEPRYAILRIQVLDLARDGRGGMRIVGEYRPRGHLGDFTPEGTRTLYLGPSGSLEAS